MDPSSYYSDDDYHCEIVADVSAPAVEERNEFDGHCLYCGSDVDILADSFKTTCFKGCFRMAMCDNCIHTTLENQINKKIAAYNCDLNLEDIVSDIRCNVCADVVTMHTEDNHEIVEICKNAISYFKSDEFLLFGEELL